MLKIRRKTRDERREKSKTSKRAIVLLLIVNYQLSIVNFAMFGFGGSASKKSCRFSNFLLWLQSVQIPPHLRVQKYNKKLKIKN